MKRQLKQIAKHINNDQVKTWAAFAVRYEAQERMPPRAKEAMVRLANKLAEALIDFDIIDQDMEKIPIHVNDVFARLPEEARLQLSDGKKLAFQSACYQEVKSFNAQWEHLRKVLEENYLMVHADRDPAVNK